MDPDQNLKEQLEIAAQILAAQDANHGEAGVDPDAGANLAELVIALDEWIRGGGFLPAAWRK